MIYNNIFIIKIKIWLYENKFTDYLFFFIKFLIINFFFFKKKKK